MIRRLFAGLLVTAVAAACGDSTGPDAEFDPVQTGQTADAVFAPVEGNPALQSLSVMSQAFSLGVAPSVMNAALAAVPDAELRRGPSLRRLQTMADAVLAFSSASPQELFPPSVLGNTYVYNPDTGMYENDPARTDAPAAGVRFILYAVDPILEQVVEPLQEVGYVDLIDESTATANVLHIIAAVGSVTAIDYIASAQLGGGGATFAVDGSLSNGTDTVDLNLTLTVSAAGLSLDYLISEVGADNSIRLEASGDPEQGSLTVVVTIQSNGHMIVLTITFTGNTAEGDISHNGDVVVTFSGDGETLVFTGADGRQLTAAEIEALQDIGDLVEHVFDSFEDVLGPAFFVFDFSL